ncbi:MAG TPA: biotin/lipoyl-binding protein, partial [Puia sp.]|nr:biotin/lipoyl-binding protein [Puia sp.]
MKAVIHGVLGAALVFLAGMTLPGCGSSSAREEPADAKKEATAPAALETFHLKTGQLTGSLQVPGELISFQQVDLYAKVSSFVKRLYADVGTQVKEGQLLAVMEAPEINSELAAAESKLKSQEAVYIASKSTYDRLVETSKTPGTVS